MRSGLTEVSKLSVAKIARALMGRPAVKTGKSYVDILPPILGCDTKSKENFIQIVDHMEKHLLPSDPTAAATAAQLVSHLPHGMQATFDEAACAKTPCVAILSRTDGQGLMLLTSGKRRY